MENFNGKVLKKIRQIRGRYDGYNSFWDELEIILKCKNPKKNEWKKLQNDIVHGCVWEQKIGEIYYRHTVHKYKYLYVATQGVAIAKHLNEEPANNGHQKRKFKEWYVFPDGKVEFCDKGKKHKLVNDYGKSIYVLVIRIGRNGVR